MKNYVFIIFLALLIKQLFSMENDVLDIKNIDIKSINNPSLLRLDIFDITKVLLDEKITPQKRIELNNTLEPIYERLIKLSQEAILVFLDKTDSHKLNEFNNISAPMYEPLIKLHKIKKIKKKNEKIAAIAIQQAKNFCYGVIDDIRNDIEGEEENFFKRDNYFAYQSIVGRLYEIHYKLTPEDEIIPKDFKELEKARKLLRIKASLYKKKMQAQEIYLEIKFQESQDLINSLEKTQKSKVSYEAELKKAKEDLKHIQELTPPNITNNKLLNKVRKSQKKINDLERKSELQALRGDSESNIDEKLNEVQEEIQRIKTSLAYLRNDLKTIAKIPQDIVKIELSTKRTNT